MPDERCPWCGSGVDDTRDYQCGTSRNAVYRDRACMGGEIVQLRARITRLEAALQTIAATHGPGTLAGDAAREGMNDV